MSANTLSPGLYVYIPRRMMIHGENAPAKPLPVLLYVEDDDPTAYLFQIAVREVDADVTVFRVTNADDGMSFLTREGRYGTAPRPDLVVLDLNLPRKSGFEVLTEIRGNRDLSDLPVVILTASCNPDDRALALASGADHYFTKPVDLDAFTETVRALCALARSDGALAQRDRT